MVENILLLSQILNMGKILMQNGTEKLSWIILIKTKGKGKIGNQTLVKNDKNYKAKKAQIQIGN